MENITRLKYDDLNIISKKFHNEAEDYAQLHSFTLIKVDALRGQWEGEAAEKFFDEMDAVLLPALKRVSESLDISQQILVKIMKLIYEADLETATYFNGSGAVGGGEFGAGLFTAAGVAAGVGVLGGGIAGAVAGGAGGAGAGIQTPPQSGSSTPGEASPEGGQPPAGEPQQTQTQTDSQAAADAPPETPGAGGGGGGAGGSGLQGDLKNLGAGLNGSPAVCSSVGGIHLGAENLPDHDFGGGSGGGLAGGGGAGGAGGAGGGSGSGGGSGAPDSGVGDGVAAGVAGIAGSAAIGGAAKVLKNKQQN